MAFYRKIPKAFNWAIAQTPQFANICPPMTLPPGAICIIETTGEGWTQPLMKSRGNTHYNQDRPSSEANGNREAYASMFPANKYMAVPRINDSFGMTSSTSRDQCRSYADQMDLNCSVAVLESQEGRAFLEPEAIQWQWFHERWKERADEATRNDGIKRYRCHNYFRFSGGIFALGQRPTELQRRLYTTPVENWRDIKFKDDYGNDTSATNQFTAGAQLDATNLVMEGLYPGNPDDDTRRFMQCLYGMDYSRMQGKKPGIFCFPYREWRPSFLEGTDYPEGRFMRRDKEKLSPSFMLDAGFMGMDWAGAGQVGAYIDWGLGGYQPKSKKPIGYYPPIHEVEHTDYWKATGASNYSQVPIYSNSNNSQNFAFGGGDFQYFGVKMWNETVGQVYQGQPTFLRHRLDNGTWIEKSPAESDILDAFAGKRGLCRARIHNGKMAVWYMNRYATDHKKHVLEFQHPTDPSRKWTETVCGNGVHAKLFTL